MVQQTTHPTTQATTINSNTTLAMPAIISNAGQNSQESSPNSATAYQQQIIKQQQQQQQFLHQHQQLARLNGFSGPTNQLAQAQYSSSQQQQESPSSQVQAEALYRAQAARPAPNYAQKPAYLSNGQQPQQPVYQTRQQYYQPVQQQQQQSPVGLSRSMQMTLSPATMQSASSMVGLTVRQVPNGYTTSSQMSPAQQVAQAQPTNQQMQQLIMGYQQQQQQQQQPSELVQPINPQQYLLPSDQEHLVQQHVDIRWSQIDQNQSQNTSRGQQFEAQQQQQQQQQHLYHQQMPNRPVGTLERVNRAFSDRDSISTVSRFNQSFAVRSQYTTAQNSGKLAQRFGFLSLTGEALKRIIGLSSDSSRRPLLGEQTSDQNMANLQRNLSLTVEGAQAGGAQKTVHGFGSNRLTSSGAKITVIDSGEDYCFKRQVFEYQLVILRLMNLACALLVLLSPVAMLLAPKMEFVFRRAEEVDGDQAALVGPPESSAPSVINGVGLPLVGGRAAHLSAGNQHQQHQQHQHAYLAPQPQWRISECTSDCDGPLIGFVARFIMLCVAYWALYFRSQTATLPRIDFHRCALIAAAVLLSLTYWLFFLLRVFDKRFNDFELQYMTIVQFASSMLESLILLHYLAVVVLELRRRKRVYCLKVLRSPDGSSRYYSCGALSVQECAQFVLDKYHCQFNSYGPYAEHLLELEGRLARPGAVSPAPSAHWTNGARRHHHSSSASRHHRSPSGSPTRSTSYRSRSQRRLADSRQPENQSKLHQLDKAPPETTETKSSARTPEQSQQQQPAAAASSEISKQQQQQQRQPDNDSNSGDQSSDATNRMKESSLETVRLAAGDNKNKQENNNNSAPRQRQRDRSDQPESQQQEARHLSARDDTESVRSARSRRSVSRSHHRHSNHRDRSSSRAAYNNNNNNNNNNHNNHHHHHQSATTSNEDEDPLLDHERKLRRRKHRLLAAVEDTFERMKQIDDANPGENHEPNQQTLGAEQAARSLYPSIARSLQKYLRITRQTGRHNLQSIYEHLSKCLLYKFSARAFLEKFTCQDPVWQQSETNLFADCRLAGSMAVVSHRNSSGLEINSWSLVCDTLLSRQITEGTFFVLRQGQVQLLVSVAKLPHLSLTEELIDERSARFIFGPNSETSV